MPAPPPPPSSRVPDTCWITKWRKLCAAESRRAMPKTTEHAHTGLTSSRAGEVAAKRAGKRHHVRAGIMVCFRKSYGSLRCRTRASGTHVLTLSKSIVYRWTKKSRRKSVRMMKQEMNYLERWQEIAWLICIITGTEYVKGSTIYTWSVEQRAI